MTDRERQPPRVAEAGLRRVEDRLDRQARALRENLIRRKAQQRARAGAETVATAPADGAPGDRGERDQPGKPDPNGQS